MRVNAQIEKQKRVKAELSAAREKLDRAHSIQRYRDEMEIYVADLTGRIIADAADKNRITRCLRVIRAYATRKADDELFQMVELTLAGDRL